MKIVSALPPALLAELRTLVGHDNVIDTGPSLETLSKDFYWYSPVLKRELGELFVVRPAGTQSPRATERLDRARRYLTSGMADKAITEVEAMPGAAAAGEWLIDARRYNEARRALDLIETAAILEPRDGPAVTAARSSGTTTP